jgi:hypothetical protein
MGLKVNTISEIPDHVAVGYYLYLLDYGWHEPLGQALRENFDRIAEITSRNNAAVIIGLGTEFNDSVLSWHGINGSEEGEMLPALLITNKPPSFFKSLEKGWNVNTDHLIIIPLRGTCETSTDVVSLIERILKDIHLGHELKSFQILKEINSGGKGSILDAVILQPNFSGIGIDLKKLLSKFWHSNNRAC